MTAYGLALWVEGWPMVLDHPGPVEEVLRRAEWLEADDKAYVAAVTDARGVMREAHSGAFDVWSRAVAIYYPRKGDRQGPPPAALAHLERLA